MPTLPAQPATNAPAPPLTLPDDLRGAQLRDADLSGRDLSARDLTGADLTRANLTGARLMGANLTDACLWQADLTRAELLQANLTRADLREATCVSAGLGHTTLRETALLAANLTGATLTGADATGADLRRALLKNAHMTDVHLAGADLSGADLSGAIVHNCLVPKANFRDTVWSDAQIRGVRDYTSAQWVGADLRGAELVTAQLLARHVADENYLWEFRQQGPAARAAYWLWWATSDCGRSILRWSMLTVSIGLFFAWAQHFVDISWGGSHTWLSSLYFSVVTLTTLGYGDVLPNSAPAQALVMAEVTVGYVMLGGLISLFTSRFGRRS